MKLSKTNEQALEAAIEKALTGTCLEELKNSPISHDPDATYSTPNKGFIIGDKADFDAKYAIDKNRFWSFLEQTQAEELAKLQRSSDWQLKILERYDRMVKKFGLLRVLRKGLEVEDAHLTFFYQLPPAGSSQSLKDKFAQNQFSTTRQIHYNQNKPNESIDMVLFINGLAIATIELKNHWTGQNARVHGINQYQSNRDPKQPLLQFGRCLVHLAVDTEEVYMTTKLRGKDTFFLPFNKGNNNGKGNPPNSNGHRTAYLWEEVFSKESLSNLIQHFIRFDGKPRDPLASKNLFFPRYHQMDVVRKIIAHARTHGVGQTYLIQHSAGSGKSYSITWAAYQLIGIYPEKATLKGAKGTDSPLFDSVIVVTDRRLLDKQIREDIKSFSEVKNIVAPAHSSKELRKSLEEGKRIIITTIQKFPFIVEGIADLSDKRFAVIIDEAHSSQSGTTADKMNRSLGSQEMEEETIDVQDKINALMKERKMKDNASYLAFTATPKNTTLERFGSQQKDGSFIPFHLYSMKQAIEEGFILDVLANYTTYKSYYEIQKSVVDNPLFDTKKAQKKLRAYVERDQRTIATKAEIMLDHFIQNVYKGKKLKGKAKGMVVTQSIEAAIRYYQSLRQLLTNKGNPFKIIIAFSGKKTVDGIDYSESDLNGFPEKDTRDQFKQDEYRLLVVANKYLTGFDEPKLCAMYVDKKLQGVLAVQALSRLNRSASKYNKRTEDLFILDFFNEIDDIQTAFEPYYTSTRLNEATDVGVLSDLKEMLGETGVYEKAEVEDFISQFFSGAPADQLAVIINMAVDRFDHILNLKDADKADFKIKSKQFVKIYGQMAAIIPYEQIAWEKLYWYLKFLIPKLIIKDPSQRIIDNILDAVDLSTYGLQRTKLGHHIQLDEGESELEPANPNPRGAHANPEELDPLDDIIQRFNERWFQGWEDTPESQKVKFLQIAKHIQAHPDFQMQYKDNPDPQNRDMALEKMIREILSKRRRQELELYRLHAKDESFQQAFFAMMKQVLEGGGNYTNL